jgi:signal peptidase I
MDPSLDHEDSIVLLNYLGAPPQKGDIVVIIGSGAKDSKNGDSVSNIKRVIATEGQKVRIDYSDGVV